MRLMRRIQRSGSVLPGLDPAAPDAALVALARHDPRAFGLLYDRYVGRVGTYCLRELGDREEAEDATSAVFHKALAALPRFDGASFGGWLFTIARHTVADAHRARRPVPLLAALSLTDGAPTPEEVVVAEESERSVDALVARLPDQQRQVVQLRRAGLTDAEIAAALGLSGGNVRVIQHRAIRRLRALRDEEAPEHGAGNA